MDSTFPKIVINIDDNNYPNWKACLKSELITLESNKIEINCKNLNLSCIDILSILDISKKYNCKVINFYSTSPQTIVSAQSLGYPSQFIIEDYSSNTSKINNQNLNTIKTHFHQGTIRSGEYINTSGDLLILGDVNPGAIVSAEGNIIIWGRLLGIAHAGSKGNSQAKISALQLRPVQLRIANKVARGPKEKPQMGLAEQACIASEKIVICPLETI